MDGEPQIKPHAGDILSDLASIRKNVLAGHLVVDAETRMHKTIWVARYGPLTCHSNKSPFDAAWRVLMGALDLLNPRNEWKWGQG